MKLLVNPINFNNAQELIKKKVNQLFIGIKGFSNRVYCMDLKEIIKLSEKCDIVLCLNRIFFDTEINKLEKLIKEISKTKIKSIMYADLAINQIIFENKYKFYQIYNPDTLITNWGQFEFYKLNKIDEVCLPRELNKTIIEEMCKNKKDLKLQLCVAGYQFMMDSRWELLSNFKQSHNINFNTENKLFYLKEEKRKFPFIINEDDSGTHLFTGYNLNLINKLNELKKMKMDTIRIDTYLHDEKWINEIVEDFNYSIKNNKIKKSNYNEQQSCGFYSSAKEDLIYLQENEK